MDIEKALALRGAGEILEALKEAETRNCEQWVIRALRGRYEDAVERELEAWFAKEKSKAGRRDAK